MKRAHLRVIEGGLAAKNGMLIFVTGSLNLMKSLAFSLEGKVEHFVTHVANYLELLFFMGGGGGKWLFLKCFFKEVRDAGIIENRRHGLGTHRHPGPVPTVLRVNAILADLIGVQRHV